MRRSILVVGQQKTGTTGVYSLIKSALRPLANEYFFSFEPSRGVPLENVLERDPKLNILTKIMYKNLDNFSLDMFDKRVMTVRDPRDTIVSTLLFKPLLKNVVGTVSMEQHERFVDGLRRKEQDPASVPLGELFSLADEVGYRKHKPRRLADEYLAMTNMAKVSQFHVVRYEDFVDGKVAELAEYLGLPLNPGAAETPSWLTHISRSRGHSAWRDWFTPADVAHYRPILDACLKQAGYAGDWDLNANPEIAAETSSNYVLDRIQKRRRELTVTTDLAGGDDTGESIATLHSMASDGNAKAAHELAMILNTSGDFGRRWPTSARYWAWQAELQGLKGAGSLRRELDNEIAKGRVDRDDAMQLP